MSGLFVESEPSSVCSFVDTTDYVRQISVLLEAQILRLSRRSFVPVKGYHERELCIMQLLLHPEGYTHVLLPC